MPDKIYATLDFTGVAIGATQTLAHGLQISGVSFVPDRIDFQYPASFEIVSADETDVTVRNTANPGGATLAWVYGLHPVLRLLGLAPDDGLMTQGMTPRPFVPGSPNAGAGGQAFDVVVLRPGGVATENVVTTMADAVALLSTLQGTRVLEFDDSVVSPIVIPAAHFDMTGVTWSTIPDRTVLVTIPEGATFTKLRAFSGQLQVTFSGATPPVADFASPAPQIDRVTMDRGALVLTSGAGPMFSVDASALFALGAESGFFSGSTEVVHVTTGNTLTVVLEGSLATVATDTISGALGATLRLALANDSPFAVSPAQSGFAGTVVFTNDTRDFTFPTAVISSVDGLTDASQLVRVNPTGGTFAVTLPSAADFRGQSITFVNVTSSTNTVTITAAGGETVNGAATDPLSGARAFVRYTSDGVSAWYKVSGAAPSSAQAFTYTVTGAEPDLSEITITLPTAIPGASYLVFPQCHGVTNIAGFDITNRTNATFHLVATGNLTAGDVIGFFVSPL